MSTIKAKNIKQTVVGGTTQPLKIGGILEDGSDAKISIDTSGNLTASNLTATLNGLLTTNGQIKFPATQNPSSDANTLDDYEEGTFTPSVRGSTTSGTASYGLRSGKYTKIGNIVEFELILSWTSFNGTGNLIITGLPFSQIFDRTLHFVVGEGLNYAASAQLFGMTNGATEIALYQNQSNSGIGNVVVDDACSYLLINGKFLTN